MRCEICNKGPQEGLTIFRVSPKGRKGVWRCERHFCREAEVGAVVYDIVRQIARGGKRPN